MGNREYERQIDDGVTDNEDEGGQKISKDRVPGSMKIVDQLEVTLDNEKYFEGNDEKFLKNRILTEQFFTYFMISSMQWRPYTDSWEYGKIKKNVFKIGQFLAPSLIFMSFLFDTSLFCAISTPTSIDWKYKITRIRNIVWELRWFIGFLLGLWYFYSRHLEWLLAKTVLPERIWAKFKKEALGYSAALVTLIIVIPLGVNILTFNVLIKASDTWWQQVIHLCGYVFCRYTSLPVFLALIAVLRLLELHIMVSGDRIKEALLRGDRDVYGAVAEHEIRLCLKLIRDMKESITITEKKIKYFIFFHLILLLFAGFFGVLSCLERLHIHVSPVKSTNATEIMLNRPLDLLEPEKRIQKAMTLITDISQKQGSSLKNDVTMKQMLQAMNETLKSVVESSKLRQKLTSSYTNTKQAMETVLEEQMNITRVYLEIGMDAMESALLYGIPLFLLIRVDNAVDSVVDSLVNLHGERGSYGFMMSTCVCEVINYMKTVRGIRVFGFQSSLFRTLILTFSGPILLSFVHSLFGEAKIPK